MKNEVPDNYIERQPPDCGPQEEDACMVCDKIDCECPELTKEQWEAEMLGVLQDDMEKDELQCACPLESEAV